MGEGGSPPLKPVILDRAACIYEHEECFPRQDCCQGRNETHLCIWGLFTSVAALITGDETPQIARKNNTDSMCHRGLNQLLVRAAHSILDP